MKNKYCPVCGSEIVCTLQRDDLYFYIVDGKVVRDTNPDLWSDDPFNFHCSHDREHAIIFDIEWREQFEKEIAKSITEVKLNV